MKYEVIVGNIGNIHQSDDERLATEIYVSYVERSKSGRGRAAGESVTLTKDNEILHEHIGTQENV